MTSERASCPHLEHGVHDGETDFGNISHGVLESPNDGIKDELELRSGDVQKRGEAVRVDSLEIKQI